MDKKEGLESADSDIFGHVRELLEELKDVADLSLEEAEEEIMLEEEESMDLENRDDESETNWIYYCQISLEKIKGTQYHVEYRKIWYI